MSVKFCSECGTKVEYNFSPPKFCSSCGAPLGIATVNESKPVDRQVQTTRASKPINDDETDADHVPNIRKLEYEIETNSSTFDLSNLVGGNQKAPSKHKTKTRSLNELTDRDV